MFESNDAGRTASGSRSSVGWSHRCLGRMIAGNANDGHGSWRTACNQTGTKKGGQAPFLIASEDPYPRQLPGIHLIGVPEHTHAVIVAGAVTVGVSVTVVSPAATIAPVTVITPVVSATVSPVAYLVAVKPLPQLDAVASE